MQVLPDSMLKQLEKLPEAKRIEWLKNMAETLVSTFNRFNQHVIVIWPQTGYGVSVMSSPCSKCGALLLEAAAGELLKADMPCDHECPEPFISRKGMQ